MSNKIISETRVGLDYPRDIHSMEFIRIRKEALQQLENNWRLHIVEYDKKSLR